MEADHRRDPFLGALVSQAAEAVGTSFTSYNRSTSSRRARLRRSHSRGHAWELVFLSAVASIAAVALLISMCSRSRMRSHALHYRDRRLSANGSPKDEFQFTCGEDLYEEEVWMVSDDGDSDADQPLQKKPRLVEEAGEGSESTKSFEDSRAAGRGLGVTTGPQAEGSSQDYSAPLRSSKSPREVQWNQHELEAAAALFELRLGRHFKVSVGQLSGPGGRTIYLQQSAPESETQSQRRTKLAGETITLARFVDIAETSAGSAQKASGASAARVVPSAAGPADGGPPGTSSVNGPSHEVEHPFFRLPRVHAGRMHARFRPEVALSGSLFPNSPVHPLCTAHELLRRPRLQSEELHILAITAERLVAHSIYYQTLELPASRPTRAAGMLGTRFLIFDVVVSTLHLLGQRCEGQWWERFTTAVPHSFGSKHLLVPYGTDRALFNRELIREMMKAMEILKTGRRAPREATIKIKQLLFTSIFSPSPFRGRRFDSWRQDAASS